MASVLSDASKLMQSKSEQPLVLLTGATGYVGGRLLGALESDGVQVRCLVRDPKRLRVRGESSTEVLKGDAMNPADLAVAMRGVTHAYYLVHSMAATADFVRRDREAATNFAAAAQAAGVSRIIYLGGLGSGDNLSPHLASRQEVGRILRESGVPTIEFRASVIVGSGSLSFDMVRSLVDRLPVMVTPRWVRIRTQPIAIEDVIAYLCKAIGVPLAGSEIFEIGGVDRVTYQDLMLEYARQRGLRRIMIPVPVLTPRLSSLWLGLVTPIYARVGRQLIESLPHETILGDKRAEEVFGVHPMGVRKAVERAIRNEDREFALTRWSDALASVGETKGWGGDAFGSRLVDSRVVKIPVPPGAVFRAVSSVGGEAGWYAWTWLWQLRGLLDLAVGGAGMRRGRRDPLHLAAGDALDFWRVEAVEEDSLLRLVAEMRLPGRAWLQFEIEPEGSSSCELRQTAIFDPIGLAGLAYWYALFPLHALVFRGLLRGIAAKAASYDAGDR
jgi:uncharacterized protein YbjT (DUF2867 family)